MERYNEALTAFDQALELRPDDDAAQANKGVALARMERYDEALAAFDRALKL